MFCSFWQLRKLVSLHGQKCFLWSGSARFESLYSLNCWYIYLAHRLTTITKVTTFGHPKAKRNHARNRTEKNDFLFVFWSPNMLVRHIFLLIIVEISIKKFWISFSTAQRWSAFGSLIDLILEREPWARSSPIGQPSMIQIHWKCERNSFFFFNVNACVPLAK